MSLAPTAFDCHRSRLAARSAGDTAPPPLALEVGMFSASSSPPRPHPQLPRIEHTAPLLPCAEVIMRELGVHVAWESGVWEEMAG